MLLDPHTSYLTFSRRLALVTAPSVPLRTLSRLLLTHAIICAMVLVSVGLSPLVYRVGEVKRVGAHLYSGYQAVCEVDQYKSEQLTQVSATTRYHPLTGFGGFAAKDVNLGVLYWGRKESLSVVQRSLYITCEMYKALCPGSHDPELRVWSSARVRRAMSAEMNERCPAATGRSGSGHRWLCALRLSLLPPPRRGGG
jgi:hypothetical protein